jgi:hypothetical protein
LELAKTFFSCSNWFLRKAEMTKATVPPQY